MGTVYKKKERSGTIYNVCSSPGGAIPGRTGPAIPGKRTGGPIPGMTGVVYSTAPPSRGILADGSPSTEGLATPGERE